MALSSLAGAVVRGINHHGKPVAAVTHSSARVGSALIWLLHSVRSIGKHAGQAPRWLCPHPPGDLHGGGVGWGEASACEAEWIFIQISRRQLPTILLQQIKKSHRLKVEWDGESFRECN